METGDELCEPPAIGSPVVFKYGREVLRGMVKRLEPYLVPLNVVAGEAIGGSGPGLTMRAERLCEASHYWPISQELLASEGIFWARGWDTEDALALQAQARLDPQNTGTGGLFVAGYGDDETVLAGGGQDAAAR
jgi:hypothetical protein